MAELVDAMDSKSIVCIDVRVQVPLPVPERKASLESEDPPTSNSRTETVTCQQAQSAVTAAVALQPGQVNQDEAAFRTDRTEICPSLPWLPTRRTSNPVIDALQRHDVFVVPPMADLDVLLARFKLVGRIQTPPPKPGDENFYPGMRGDFDLVVTRTVARGCIG